MQAEQLEEVEKTVEQYLNEIDYSVDPNYTPSQFALEFVTFIKLVEGGEPENKTPVIHYKMLDNFVVNNGRDTINMCHRGVAKSTLKEYLILYLGVNGKLPGFGKVPYALYVSDSIDNGVKKMRKSLEFRWNNSEFLQQYIPEINFTDIRWEFTNIAGNSFVVSGYGAKTGVRGTRENGSRPVLALLDDLISDSDAKSPTVIEAIEATVYNAINHALHPQKRKIIWSGTPFNSKDPLYKAVESGAWNVNVYPVCEKFPCEREEFRGSWPDRFTYDYISAQYEVARKTGMVEAFNQELMLRIMSDEDRLIQDSDLRWFSRNTLVKNRSAFNFYVTTDFATSEKESGDFSVISVWALDCSGNWYWVDGVCRKQRMDQNIDDLFRLCQIYKPLEVGIEVTGQQGGFISWIQNEMMTRNCYFNLSRSAANSASLGIRPNTNKMERFQTVVPWFKLGRIYFPMELKQSPPMIEAYEELSLACPGGFKSKHDDFIDTISMLALINAWKPSDQQEPTLNKDGLWDFEDEEEDLDSMGSYLV